MAEKLKVKDLVSIGVFGVIYLVLLFGIGMMEFIMLLVLLFDE